MMRKFKFILILLTILLVIPFSVFADESNTASEEVKLYFFHGDGCGYCANASEWFTEIEAEYGSKFEIIRCRDNKILLNNCPFHAVGKGQSLNISAKSLNISGYLTDQDKELISIGSEYGFNDYMASFVESYDDLSEIISLNKWANIISKIESLKGIKFILENGANLNLMVARDDLFINSDCSYEMINYLKYIISKDKNAICASKIFSNLCNSGKFSMNDYIDLEYMYLLGYRNYMLQDDVKGETLKLVLKGFGDFKRG